MPAPSPGELAGDRDARRRVTSALVTRDPVPRQDPLGPHTKATVAGAVLAVLALGAAALWGRIDAPADWRAAQVVVGEGSGALYVVAHGPDRLVGVPNLASARLVAAALADPTTGTAGATGPGASGEPVEIADDDLDAAPRARPVGIADAPALPAPGTPVPAAWSVCDAAVPDPTVPDPWSRPRVTTSVRVGDATPGRPLAAGEGLLLRDRFGGTWLVHDGVRARVDVADPAVVGALGLAGVVPRPTTTSLLNALAEGPVLTPPALAGRGLPGPAGQTVGSVLRLESPGGPGLSDRFVVVERGGVQEVPALVADLVRLADPARPAGVPSAPPGLVAAAPRSAEIDVAAYPAAAPRPAPLAGAPVTCVTLRAGDTAATPTVLDAGAPGGVTLGGHDGSGDRVDTASVPGGGMVVRAVPAGQPTAPGVLAVVSGSGTVSAVPDADTAARLDVLPDGGAAGVGAVPDAVLRLLPTASPLTVEAATRPLA